MRIVCPRYEETQDLASCEVEVFETQDFESPDDEMVETQDFASPVPETQDFASLRFCSYFLRKIGAHFF